MFCFEIFVFDFLNLKKPQLQNFKTEEMDFCEMLAQVEGHVSVNYIDTRKRRPHNLTKLLSKEEISAIREKDKKLQKLFDNFEDMYSAAYEAGIRIEPDKFGGFCLVNRTGRVIRIGEIVSTVGLLGKKRKDRS